MAEVATSIHGILMAATSIIIDIITTRLNHHPTTSQPAPNGHHPTNTTTQQRPPNGHHPRPTTTTLQPPPLNHHQQVANLGHSGLGEMQLACYNNLDIEICYKMLQQIEHIMAISTLSDTPFVKTRRVYSIQNLLHHHNRHHKRLLI